jgi:tetratricopeptide (TPR) repeat protein
MIRIKRAVGILLLANNQSSIENKKWRCDMRNKLPKLILSMTVCAFILGGCKYTSPAALDQNTRTASGIRKAELLRELDKKWENPAALYELGQLYHAERDWSKAEWYYNSAIGSNPAYRDAQAALVKLQFDKGDRSRGGWLANTYMTQVAASAEQLLTLGIAFENQGLGDYALKCYQSALKTAPDLYTVSRQLGYYYLARNKKDLAKENFIHSFQLNSSQADVAGELGRLGVAVRIPQAVAPNSDSTGQLIKPATGPK